MRKISAQYIYLGNGGIIKKGVIVLNDESMIIDIINPEQDSIDSISSLEFYNGIITPGFVNAHCHLELSYMKELIPKNQGLVNFIKTLNREKKDDYYVIKESIKIADSEMTNNGIVAVGDICNSNSTLEIKSNSKIKYYSFIELFGIENNNANNIFSNGKKILEDLIEKYQLEGSIVPHSCYSVSSELFNLMSKYWKFNDIITIHNQESDEENKLFKLYSGKLFNLIYNEKSFINQIDKKHSSINDYLIDKMPKNNNKIFVHNTFSSEKDIKNSANKLNNVYWCLCPKSNLFIENNLPDFNHFLNYENNVVVGTDSYASNNSLSILEEIKTITKFCDIGFNSLIKWVTINGSKALGLDNTLGSIEIGKSPGINLISNFDYTKMTITDSSKVKVLA